MGSTSISLVKARALAAACALLVLAGCSNILTSTKVTDDKQPSGEPIAVYSLPRGLIKIESKLEVVGSDKKLKVTVSELIVPDTDTSFRVDYGRSWFSADALKIGTQRGLLTTVSTHSDDRTSEAIVNLARSFGAAQGFLLPAVKDGPSPASDDDRTSAACAPAREFTIIVDPHHDLDPARPNGGLPLWLSIEPVGEASLDLASLMARPSAETAKKMEVCNQGLCTRSAKPVRVRLNKKCSENAGAWQDAIVYLPDESQFTPVRLERSTFADKCFGIGFDQGMIKEVRLRNESAAENFTRLPEDILRALVSVPTELIQLRYNHSVARRDLTGAELSRLQAEKALQDYVRGAQSSPGEAPKPGDKNDKVEGPPDIADAPALTEADCNLDKAPT